MQTTQALNSKSQRRSPKSTKSHSLRQKHEELQSEKEQGQNAAVTNASNPRSQEINISKQINKLLKQCKKHPTQSLSSLCSFYQTHPSSFYESDARKSKQRPIFDLLLSQIQHCNAFPLTQREKTVIINQNFLHWIGNRKDPIRPQQLNKINQMQSKLFETLLGGESDRIIQNMLSLFLKLPFVLASSCQKQEEILFCQELINHIMINLARTVDANIDLTKQTQDNIIEFHNKSLHLLPIISNPSTITNYHLFSFATLALTSKYPSLCKKIISDASSCLQEKFIPKQQSIEQKSMESSELKNKTVLLVSSLLKFDSVLESESIKKKSNFIKEVTLLTLLNFKSLILRLIDQLQHLSKLTIPPSIIRGMFQIAKFCNCVNKPNILSQIIKKIQSVKEMGDNLSIQDKFFSASQKEMQPFDAILKNIQKSLFDIMCKIQKSICNYNLEIFMDLYIEHPLTFRSQYFIEQTFKNQHDTIILSFMKAFTAKWALTDLKTFDFSFYLLHFIRKCIAKDTMDTLGAFIKQVTVQQLIKVNAVIFKLSFEEDYKKYMVPQNSCRKVQFSSLTSAGYCEKFMLINQLIPQFSQQLMWKQLIHHLVHSLHYIVVKSYYNVANYEFTVDITQHDAAISKLIKSLDSFIDNQEIEEIYATFHLLYCILFRKDAHPPQSNSKHEGRLLQIIIAKGRKLLTIYDSVCARRRSAMSSINMSKEMMSQTMRYFDRLKKMNGFFLKSVHLWVESLTNIKDLISHNNSEQDIIQLLLQLSKDNEYKQFHQVRYLSHYCSQKYFNNIIEYKIKGKILKKEIIAFHYIMVLREIINTFIDKYPSQNIENQQCLQVPQILNYYSFVLHLHIEVTNQRQILKSKLLILYQIVQLTAFFKTNPSHHLYQLYCDLYRSSFKRALLQIIVQNPQYVSKYERQFIIHMRVVGICEMVKKVGDVFEIVPEKQTYSLIYQLCYDKHIQIRFMIINMLTSRFKHEAFNRFLSNKYETATLLTTIAIFENNQPIKTIASRIVEAFKAVGKDCSSLGLIILLHSIKHILNFNYRNLCKQEYYTYIDSFLTHFHKCWLNQKQWEYSTYNFASKFIEESKISFIVEEPTFQSHVQCYYVEKQGSDYCLERQIKEYLKQLAQFSFQFPPQENIPNPKKNLINNLLYSLPYRIFQKIKQIINKKSRASRILKFKKDIDINWQMLERNGIVQYKKVQQRQLINLRL